MKTRAGIKLRPIPVAPNKDYAAGEDGRIYSRTRYKGFGRKVYVDWYALQGHKNAKGYAVVSMCHNNEKTTHHVHRLICMAFHGMPEPATLQTRHLDGNPENNVPKNLRWGTQAENWLDRKAHGRGNEGDKHPMVKVTDEECQHLKWAIAKGLCSRRHAARVLGLNQSSVSYICRFR